MAVAWKDESVEVAGAKLRMARAGKGAPVLVLHHDIGTLERLLVTPVGPLEFLMAKMVPVACVGLFDAFLITAVAMAWFGIPLRGDVLGVAGATLVLLVSTQGLGLLASTYAATQQQAMMSAAFFIMPMIVLSGLERM